MRRISSIFSSKKLPLAFIICLLLLSGVEILVRFNLYALASFSNALLLYKNNFIKSQELKGINALIMGDSRALGIHAKEISDYVTAESKEDFQFFNYSYPQSGVESYYLLLKDYMKYHNTPKLIIFIVSPITLTGEVNFKHLEKPYAVPLYNFTYLFSAVDSIKYLPRQAVSKALLIKLENNVKFIAYRGRIKELITHPESYSDKSNLLQRSIQLSNGGNLIVRNILPTQKEIENSVFFKKVFVLDDYSIHWYEEFFQLAKENNIKIIVLNAPLIKSIFENRQKNGSNQIYINKMKSFKQQFDHIYLTDPLIIPYEMNYFSDDQHLNRDGYKIFSEYTGKIISRVIIQNGL